ncbi:MAG: HAD-IA family hydrolase, partial [Rubrivivax sp.]|nr:HAD-IA family hydrolase [Rubrivivax sp.]
VALVGELLGRPAPADHLAQFARRTQTAFTAALQPVAGILALLSALKVPCCVASNGNRAKMNFTLGHTGLLPQFQGRMYSADDVVNPKPAPDLFLHAARCHGVAPRRCVVIEDTATGIRAARAAAMTACGYAGLTPAAQLQAAGADAVFSRMGQLQAWLGDRGCAS